MASENLGETFLRAYGAGQNIAATRQDQQRESESRNIVSDVFKSKGDDTSGALKESAKRLGASGDIAGMSNVLKALGTLNEDEKKDMESLAKQNGGLALGLLNDLTTKLKQYSSDLKTKDEAPQKAFEDVQYEYGKYYYASDTDRRGLPKPEELTVPSLYKLANESAYTHFAIQSMRSESDIAKEKVKAEGGVKKETERRKGKGVASVAKEIQLAEWYLRNGITKDKAEAMALSRGKQPKSSAEVYTSLRAKGMSAKRAREATDEYRKMLSGTEEAAPSVGVEDWRTYATD